jgi:hypothetical protein
MQIEDIVGVRFGIGNEVDTEDENRGWNLEHTGGDSLTSYRTSCLGVSAVSELQNKEFSHSMWSVSSNV